MTLALSVALHVDALATWWVELLRYLPLPLLLVPALLALGASWLMSWPWRLAAAATVVLVVSAVMGLELHGGDTGSGRVRLMTFNAKVHVTGEAGLEAIAREIARHDPDVLVMQDADLSRWPDVPPQLRVALADRTVYRSGQYVVASRLPMSGCRDREMSTPHERHRYVRCRLHAHGVDVELVTAHLKSPRQGLNATRHEGTEGLDEWHANLLARLIQVGRLVRDLAGSARPLIVAGDLNAPEHSPVIQQLMRRLELRDAFSAAGTGFGYTHGHALRPRFSFLRIDHVLVSPEIGVADCHVGGSEASEHRPVIADLLLAPERR
ncbi:MAG: endonuclease/exonuclease/phosphatase family protein [Burkholderiaceae bacterium]